MREVYRSLTEEVDLLKREIYDAMDPWSMTQETVDDAIVEIVKELLAHPLEWVEGPTLRDRLRVVVQGR